MFDVHVVTHHVNPITLDGVPGPMPSHDPLELPVIVRRERKVPTTTRRRIEPNPCHEDRPRLDEGRWCAAARVMALRMSRALLTAEEIANVIARTFEGLPEEAWPGVGMGDVHVQWFGFSLPEEGSHHVFIVLLNECGWQLDREASHPTRWKRRDGVTVLQAGFAESIRCGASPKEAAWNVITFWDFKGYKHAYNVQHFPVGREQWHIIAWASWPKDLDAVTLGPPAADHAVIRAVVESLLAGPATGSETVSPR